MRVWLVPELLGRGGKAHPPTTRGSWNPRWPAVHSGTPWTQRLERKSTASLNSCSWRLEFLSDGAGLDVPISSAKAVKCGEGNRSLLRLFAKANRGNPKRELSTFFYKGESVLQ